MAFLFRKISYKISLLIFVVFILLAATVANYTLKLKSENSSRQQNKEIFQLKEKINKIDKNTPPLEEGGEAKKDSTNSTSTSPDSTNNEESPTSTPPTSQPPTTPPPSSPPPSTSPKTVTVTISSGAVYSALNLTINSGDTIKWVNNDSQTRWPASNPHPIHTDYPGFDSGGISPGSSWSFRFDNKGNWGWHDHTRPSITGTISVL